MSNVPNIGLTEDQAGIVYKHFIKVIDKVLGNEEQTTAIKEQLVTEFFGDKINPLYEIIQGQGPRTNCAVMIGDQVYAPGTLFSTIVAAARSQYVSRQFMQKKENQ